MVNNLGLGTQFNDDNECDCGLYDDHGREIHQNIAQASINKIQQGRRFDRKNKCIDCNNIWLDFSNNYTSRCGKCGSSKMIGEAYQPEKQIQRLVDFTAGRGQYTPTGEYSPISVPKGHSRTPRKGNLELSKFMRKLYQQ